MMCAFCIVPGMVSNLTSRPRLTSIVLTWNELQVPNGVAIRYEVIYRVSDDIPVTANTTASSTTFTIPSLTPHTRVSDISVSVYTGMGQQGAVTVLQDVTTLARPRMHACTHTCTCVA